MPEEKLSKRELKKKRKERKKEIDKRLGRTKKRYTTVIKYIAILSVAVTALILYINNFDFLRPENLVNYIRKNIIYSPSGAGFPKGLPGGNFKEFIPGKKNIIYLTDTHFYVYNQSGKEMLALQHLYGSPYVAAKQDYYLLYDNYGMQFRAYSKTKKLFETELQNRIFSVAVSEKGTFGVITDSQKYLGEILIYDNKGKNIFNWFSADHQIRYMDFMDDGKTFAVGTISGIDGIYVSDINIFNVGKSDVQSKTRINDGFLISLDCKVNGNTVALFDNKAVVIDRKGKTVKTVEFEDKPVSVCNINDDNFAVVFETPYAKSRYLLNIYDSDGEKKGSVEFAEKPLQITGAKGKTAVLEKNQISIYANDGKLNRKIEIKGDTTQIICTGQNIYTKGLTEINQYSL